MKKPKKNWVEWSIFAVSLAVILATVGALVYEAFSLGARPADPQVTLGAVKVHGSYFAVPVTVENPGDETAEAVRIEVMLKLPEGSNESSGFNLQYLPRGATRHGWVTFVHDPRRGSLQARVLGYERP